MDLSEKITQLANEYDADREADGMNVRALLQGALAGAIMAQLQHGPRFGPVAIRDVELDVDEHGNYLPYFTVVTHHGEHRIRVSVEYEG